MIYKDSIGGVYRGKNHDTYEEAMEAGLQEALKMI